MKKMNPEDKKKRVTICLDPETMKILQLLSIYLKMSKSSVITYLINNKYRVEKYKIEEEQKK